MATPDGFPLGDAVDAHAVMRPWWRALADNDDGAVLRFNHPGSVGDSGPGLAARIRDGLGVTVEQCATMGVFNTVSILRGGAWAFFCKTGWRTESYERTAIGRYVRPDPAASPGRGWMIKVERTSDGSWRVWGWDPDGESIDKVILPPLA